MRRLVTTALLLGWSFVVAPAALAEIRVKVTRQSLTRIDVDGGAVQGLALGDRLRVVEGEKTVAELEVLRVAQRSAQCSFSTSSSVPLETGEAPMFALIFVLVARPIAIGSSL